MSEPTNPEKTQREKTFILIAKGWINEGKGRWHHPGFDDDTIHSFDVAWEEQDNVEQPSPSELHKPTVEMTDTELTMFVRKAHPDQLVAIIQDRDDAIARLERRLGHPSPVVASQARVMGTADPRDGDGLADTPPAGPVHPRRLEGVETSCAPTPWPDGHGPAVLPPSDVSFGPGLENVVAFDFDERWIKWRYESEAEIRAIVTRAVPAVRPLADGRTTK